MNVFAVRAAELTQDRPELTAAVVPLLKTREVIEHQIADRQSGISADAARFLEPSRVIENMLVGRLDSQA
jgi:hypothetical protein